MRASRHLPPPPRDVAATRIALDAMGGDHAPGAVIEGVLAAAGRHPGVSFALVGQPDIITAELTRQGAAPDAFAIHPASQVVGMDEKPSQALRSKKNSSMRVGVELVRDGQADAFVSSGNTGALMAFGKVVLKTLPGIDRPAIASVMPSVRGQTVMLDLGANVDCSAQHLFQFALMGEVFARMVVGLERPTIGLLNVGEEEMKGNEVVRDAGERLRASSMNFIGNVEGTDIFLGEVDVVVCDGFVGNISLKTSEGMAKMLVHFLKDAFSRNWLTKLGYLLARPALAGFRDRFDPRRYNGAMLLGLNGIVVKSHGSADGLAFGHAVEVAARLASRRINQEIAREIVQTDVTQGSQRAATPPGGGEAK